MDRLELIFHVSVMAIVLAAIFAAGYGMLFISAAYMKALGF